MHVHVATCTQAQGCSKNLYLTEEESKRLAAERRERRVFAVLDAAPESARQVLAGFYAAKVDDAPEYDVYKTQAFRDRYLKPSQ